MSPEPTAQRVPLEEVKWDVWVWVTQTGNYRPYLIGSYESEAKAMEAKPTYGDRMSLLKLTIPYGWLS